MLVQVSWDKIETGDILQLKQNEVVPADLLLLDSSCLQDSNAFCIVDGKSSHGTLQ